jgi:hypothetical protein
VIEPEIVVHGEAKRTMSYLVDLEGVFFRHIGSLADGVVRASAEHVQEIRDRVGDNFRVRSRVDLQLDSKAQVPEVIGKLTVLEKGLCPSREYDECTQGVVRGELHILNLDNVSEWCHEWYGPYPTGPVTDPPGATSGSQRVVRGGAWSLVASFARAARRHRLQANNRFGAYGGRIARTAE